MKHINKTLDIVVWPLVAVMIFLALQFIGVFVSKTMAFFAFGNEQLDSPEVIPWSMLISSLLTAAILAFIKPFRLYREFRLWVCGNSNALYACIIIIMTMFAASAVNELLENYAGMKMDEQFKEVFENAVTTPVGIISLVLAGPVCEELVFRAGIMKPMMERNVKPWIPIFMSSLIFALIHGNMSQMIYGFLMGFMFAIVYYRTKSLIITTILHILNNLLMVTMMCNVENYDEITMEQYLGLGPLLAFLSVSLIIITLLIRHFWKNTEIYQNNLCQ